MDKLIFKGIAKDFREFFLRRFCESIGADTNKWRYSSTSLMDGIRVLDTDTDRRYKMTSGSSGCNFDMVDSTGGHHQLGLDKNVYEFYEKSL